MKIWNPLQFNNAKKITRNPILHISVTSLGFWVLSFTFVPHVGRSIQSSVTTISKEKKQSSASSDLLDYFFFGLN